MKYPSSMRLLLLASLICFFGHQRSNSQVVLTSPLSERITNYKMDVSLNPEKKTVSGTMTVTWKNISSKPVQDLMFHMYLNAFMSNHTTFNMEGGRFAKGLKEQDFGWVEINSMKISGTTDITGSMKYIQPDDGNIHDFTVLQVILPEPVAPGKEISVDIVFKSKLPLISHRTGFNKDYFFVAQWFPKLGVYEPAGMRGRKEDGWNCHQFHANSEFYANHSVYDVNITVPSNYVVGSGGLLISEKQNDDGTKKLVYRAEDIVDFAWTAWPKYVVFEDQWEHVKIRLLMAPDHKSQADRHFLAAKNGLSYYSKHVGPYPWPHLTIIDPPAIGQGAGGMEYTTLITAGTTVLMPEGIHMPEMVTLHEYGHAIFMGILASNEFEEPWLDEGMNSYMESRAMDASYGPNKGMIDLPFISLSDKSFQRMSYLGGSSRQATNNTKYSWDYPHGSYGLMSYSKAATWLLTLQGLVGDDVIDEIFRTYYKRWAFKHPTTQNFVDIVNEIVPLRLGDKYGPDMNWFFEQTLYGTGICDYEVSRIKILDEKEFRGMVKSDSLYFKSEEKKDSLKWSVIELQRIGEVMIPVEVLIHFDNGDEVLELWDGKDRTKDYKYLKKEKVVWVKIDPNLKNPMDKNYLNNSKTFKSDLTQVRRYSNLLRGFLQFIIMIFSI
ncbi:MAG: M1 family metallopeptidase [Tenuifilaceae bacterium]